MFINVENVALGYKRRVVISNFSGRFYDDRINVLIGPSGSGKSTLLAAISGFLSPLSGDIWLVDERSKVRVATSDVAWVPQGANALGARSAMDNVLIGPLADGRGITESRERAVATLEMVDLADKSAQMANTLSGGELQRVSFARALACDRKIILADEPTANLDRKTATEVANVLRRIRPDSIIVVATHDPLLFAGNVHLIDIGSIATES